MQKIPLPIDAYLEQIKTLVRRAPCLVLQAAPGSGKTTRVPPALLSLFAGKILVLEPRRLAARMSAERVAEELGETCGESVGYRVRFESAVSGKTRLEFLTEGLFLRQLTTNPRLEGISAVILDEFHERHIHTDVALALLQRLQSTLRPDLRLVIMSATLPGETLTRHLQGAEFLGVEGRVFPVRVDYLDERAKAPLEQMIVKAAQALTMDPASPGHILIFLPGSFEIRKAKEALLQHGFEAGNEIHQLHGSLSLKEQRQVFLPSSRRKIILATNVAETSITIEDITGVIDSGLAKIAGHATWSGLPTLDVKQISQASAIQRAGRAGRTAPGIAKRLYSELDFSRRPGFEKPEIQRVDLMQTVLDLAYLNSQVKSTEIFDIKVLPWLEPPAAAAVEASYRTLQHLGALTPDQKITDLGRAMARLPLHPRMSRVVMQGDHLKMTGPAVLAAAIMSEGMLLNRNAKLPENLRCDITYQMELFRASYAQGNSQRRWPAELPLHAARRVEATLRALASLMQTSFDSCLTACDSDTVSLCLLAGFPDRVAQVRKSQRSEKIELNLCGGGRAELARTSAARSSEFLIAIEAEESVVGGSHVQVRVASGIEPENLVADPAHFLTDTTLTQWDDVAQRCRRSKRLSYQKLLIEELPLPVDLQECADVLFSALSAAWPKPFEDDHDLLQIRGRLNFLKGSNCTLDVPDFSAPKPEFLLRHIVTGKTSFAEIRAKPLNAYIYELIPPTAAAKLEALAPQQIRLHGKRFTEVHYEPPKPPWVAARIQDFFGTMKTPKVLGNTLPVVVHLLAPNAHAVQVTTDLEGFWERVYPSLRQALSRRYPRHFWPEDPRTAEPQLKAPRKKPN